MGKKVMNQSNPFRAQEEQELTPSSHASSNVSSEWNVVYSDYLRKTEVCQAYFCPLYLYKYTSSPKTHEHSYSTIMFLLVLPGQVRREVISSHQHGDLMQQNTFSTWYRWLSQSSFFSFFFTETRYYYTLQPSLKLGILSPQPSKCWDNSACQHAQL